ncbi:MAG: DUF4167 domain-containing protein [Maricaulaceae bacterium]
MKRQRNRSRSKSNNTNRHFESNGPDVKIRGSASHVYEKYQQLARDAFSSGDRVMGENYSQHAEHYYRIVRAQQPNAPPPRQTDDYEDADVVDTAPGAQPAASNGGENGDGMEVVTPESFDMGEGEKPVEEGANQPVSASGGPGNANPNGPNRRRTRRPRKPRGEGGEGDGQRSAEADDANAIEPPPSGSDEGAPGVIETSDASETAPNAA